MRQILLANGELPNLAILTLIRSLELSAYQTYKATLTGNPSLYIKALFQEIKNPEVGDLVVETSTLIHRVMRSGVNPSPVHSIEGIGYLLRVVQEPIPSWDKEENEQPAPTEKVTYLRLFDGSEMRWTNADFIKVVLYEPKIFC